MSDPKPLPIKNAPPQLGMASCISWESCRAYFSRGMAILRIHTGTMDALLALLLGGLHTLAFAPTPHGGWLTLFTLPAFFILLARTPTARIAARQGLIFGIGHFGSGLAWLTVSLHVYGGLSLALSLILLLLCVLYLSLYPALTGWVWRALSLQPSKSALTWQSSMSFACMWTLCEWLRGTLFTGFPWLVSGYTQVDGPLTGYASILGVYGISWLLAWIAALGAQALIMYKPQWLTPRPPTDSNGASLTWKYSSPRQALLVRLMLCAGLMGIALICQHISWTSPQGKPLNIRLLQGNIPQSTKINTSNIEGMLALYQKLITEKPAELILTPETAAPLPIDELPASFARALRQFSDQTGSFILLGGIGRTFSALEDDTFYWTNSLFGIAPRTLAITVYNKRHLVPFGEYIPWGFAKIMAYLQLPLASFMQGPVQQANFRVGDQTIAASICYEDIFGEELARTLRQANPAASLIINSTNLGWFGNTIALAQHRQMAQMRALETARPMLSAANTGITAAIDQKGKIIAELPPFTTASLNVTLAGRIGTTPYIFYGNAPVLIGCFGWLAWIMVYALRTSKKI